MTSEHSISAGESARGIERYREVSTLGELMTLYDQPFVKAAYSVILGRPADPIGLVYYASRLRHGHSRISVLDQLAKSSEAVEGWDKLPGLSNEITRFRASRSLKGWRLALGDPELSRTPAARRARMLQNSISGERQRLDESLSRLSEQQESVRHMVADLYSGGKGLVGSVSSAYRGNSMPKMRVRRVEEVRDFDLPPAARAVLKTLRF